MEVFLALLGALSFAGLMIAVGVLLNGLALSLLWSWFIVPLFPSMPVLTVGQSIGVAMVVGFLTYQYVDAEPSKDSKKWLNAILTIIVRPILSIVLGFIVHSFIF